MATVGADCHVTLQHAGVNGGAAVGFVVKGDRRGPVVEVGRPRQGWPVWGDGGPGRRTVRVTVLGVAGMLAPSGAEYVATVGQVRAALEAFWATTTPMALGDALGTMDVMWEGLRERRYGDGAEWECEWVVVGG